MVLGVASAWLAGACLAYLAWLAWLDFVSLKIRNRDVALLLAMSLLHWSVRPEGLDFLSLAGGLLLFSLGFVFWNFKLVGAGDAKLFLPLGIMIGWDQLLVFAVALVPASFATLLMFWSARALVPEASSVGSRLRHLAKTRHVPYAIPLFLATIPAMIPWIAPF